MKKSKNKIICYPDGGVSGYATNPEEQAMLERQQQQAGYQQLDSAGTQIPVYGQIYGAAKGASSMGKGLIQRDEYGVPTSNTGRGADALLTPIHEQQINAIKNKNWGDLAGSTLGAGFYAPIKAHFNKDYQYAMGGVGDSVRGDDPRYMKPNEWINYNKGLGYKPVSGPTPSVYPDFVNPNSPNKPISYMPNLSSRPTIGQQHQSVQFGSGTNYNPNTGTYTNPVTGANITPIVQQYDQGGVGQPNAELEKSENTVAPDGEFTQYQGPSHENGGIPTELEKGELVFSDRLKKNGKTFAKLNKVNNTNKEDDVLNNTKTNTLQKVTANLMKEAKLKRSIELFSEQESLKQSKIDSYKKKMGGIQEAKYRNGGIYIKPSHRGRFTAYKQRTGQTTHQALHSNNPHVRQMANFANNASHWNHAYGGVHGLPKYGDGNPLAPNTTRTYDDTQGMEAPYYTSGTGENYYHSQDNAGINDNILATEPYQDNIGKGNYVSAKGAGGDGSPKGTNWSAYANLGVTAGSLIASNIGNMYDLNRSKNANLEHYNKVAPSLLDYKPDIQYNNMQFKRAGENIKSASAGNSSTYINNRKDLAINQALTNARIRQSYENQNAVINNTTNQYNNEVGIRETIANMQNVGANRNLRSQALHNIGSSSSQAMMGANRDNNMANRDKEFLNILATRYPEAINDPALKQYFENNK